MVPQNHAYGQAGPDAPAGVVMVRPIAIAMVCGSTCRCSVIGDRALGISRIPAGGHTDADTRGHTPHERTPRWHVSLPSELAQAAETGPVLGSTVPHGRGGHRAPSHTPAAP